MRIEERYILTKTFLPHRVNFVSKKMITKYAKPIRLITISPSLKRRRISGAMTIIAPTEIKMSLIISCRTKFFFVALTCTPI